MAETTVAESSPAEVADVFGGEQVSMAEFSNYRQSGELPERFKPAPTTDAPEQTAVELATEPEADSDDAQDPPPKGSEAQKRILQLLAEKKELQRKLDAVPAAKTDVKTEPSTAQNAAAPQTYAEWRKTFKPSAWVEQYSKENPTATYEDANAAMADHLSDAKDHFRAIEQRQQSALNALKEKMEDARSRYTDADTVIFPTGEAIRTADIPVTVKTVIADSDVFPDLCYVIGSDPDELKTFISLAKSSPRAALAKVFEYERGIKAELAKIGKGSEEPNGGKAPESKKTNAPRPVSPVSGASSRAFDVSDDSLSADEWMRKRNEQVLRRQRG